MSDVEVIRYTFRIQSTPTSKSKAQMIRERRKKGIQTRQEYKNDDKTIRYKSNNWILAAPGQAE
jgi:hypothetical protein